MLFLRAMARPCTVCHHPRLPDIAVDVANGVSDVAIAKRYGLARASMQRHRQHMGAPNSIAAAERKGAAFQALASLPSVAEVNQAYAAITSPIDAIATKAEQQDSLAIALMGLKELRSTVTAQAALAGHVGSGQAVQVNTQVNVDLGSAVKELIAAIRPRPDASIPPELAIHLGDADVTPEALKAPGGGRRWR
jgi:hypothetical protein